MHPYPQIINRLRRTPWAATPATIEAVRDLLNASLRQPAGQRVEVPAEASALPRLSPQAAAFFAMDEERPGTSRERKPYAMRGATAVVPVFGVIGKHLSSLETLCGGLDIDQLMSVVETAAADPDVESMVLWFHSPGGVVTGLPEAAARLRSLSGQMEIYAYTDGMMCSAAYWLASQCSNVFSAPSSDVGSIGVYLAWLDETEAYESRGYHLELIKAGDFKAMGHPLQHLSEDERSMLQADVDDIYARFTAAVTSARPEIQPATMQGQTFGFDAQIDTGLVDAHYDSIAALLADIESVR